jgi:hypothetical protein
MKIYLYNEQGIYCGRDLADPDPLNPDSFLIPANATDIEPPELNDKELAVFNVALNAWGKAAVIIIEKTLDEQIAEQYAAIDVEIAQTIKKNGDYDDLGELGLYLSSTIDVFVIEAKTLWQWVQQCHIVQAEIKQGKLVLASVDDALDYLPDLLI